MTTYGTLNGSILELFSYLCITKQIYNHSKLNRHATATIHHQPGRSRTHRTGPSLLPHALLQVGLAETAPLVCRQPAPPRADGTRAPLLHPCRTRAHLLGTRRALTGRDFCCLLAAASYLQQRPPVASRRPLFLLNSLLFSHLKTNSEIADSLSVTK